MAKKEKAYQNVKVECTGESNHIAANGTFFAVALQGGGGPVLVHPLAKVGRVEVNAPRINVHKAKVVDIDFSPFSNNLIATAGEDCLIKLTVFPSGGLTDSINDSNATLQGHEKKLNQIKFHPTANNILVSSAFDNTVKVWDIEKQKEVVNIDNEHTDLPVSLDWNEDGSLLATSCKDHSIRLFDPRKKSSIQKGQGSDGNKGSRICWLGNSGKFLSVGHDKGANRKLSVYDSKKIETPLCSQDIDSGAGVICPFFDADNNVLYLAGKGDAAIRFYEFSNEDPFIFALSEFRDNESSKGCCFIPKTAVDVKACEISVALRVMRDWISPVSFQVPRKSDIFQGDLYPDTYAGKAMLSADEWLSGQDKAPAKRSMKPGASKDEKKEESSLGNKKSAEQLERELTAANARIAELEAQLAKVSTQ
jgi:coronin-1B/1C/6